MGVAASFRETVKLVGFLSIPKIVISVNVSLSGSV